MPLASVTAALDTAWKLNVTVLPARGVPQLLSSSVARSVKVEFAMGETPLTFMRETLGSADSVELLVCAE